MTNLFAEHHAEVYAKMGWPEKRAEKENLAKDNDGPDAPELVEEPCSSGKPHAYAFQGDRCMWCGKKPDWLPPQFAEIVPISEEEPPF